MGENGAVNYDVMAERTAAAAVVGGTVASATGGNFIDGARTGAYGELYNDITHAMQQYKSYQTEQRAKANAGNPLHSLNGRLQLAKTIALGAAQQYVQEHGNVTFHLAEGEELAFTVDMEVTKEGYQLFIGGGPGEGAIASGLYAVNVGAKPEGFTTKFLAMGNLGKVGGGFELVYSQSGFSANFGKGFGIGEFSSVAVGYTFPKQKWSDM